MVPALVLKPLGAARILRAAVVGAPSRLGEGWLKKTRFHWIQIQVRMALRKSQRAACGELEGFILDAGIGDF